MDKDNNTTYHPDIKAKLDFFLTTGKIPHIIFHGPNGSGKRTIVHQFISDIYQHDKELIKSYVMYVNCAHGKGIKFVREELKFFAKTHVNVEGNGNFKTIVLLNANELTIDAQSALRRCIELFSHTTRFFIVVQDKYKLLKPILSRLCEIFVYEPVIKGKKMNLHAYNVQKSFNIPSGDTKMYTYFDSIISPIKQKIRGQEEAALPALAPVPPALAPVPPALALAPVQALAPVPPALALAPVQALAPALADTDLQQEIMQITLNIYEKGYSGLDLMKYIEKHYTDLDDIHKYQMLLVFNNYKKEFRNEKLFILFILNFMLLRSVYDLENISFM